GLDVLGRLLALSRQLVDRLLQLFLELGDLRPDLALQLLGLGPVLLAHLTSLGVDVGAPAARPLTPGPVTDRERAPGAVLRSSRGRDARADKTVALRPERAVVDRLRLRALAVRPRHDRVGRSQRQLQRVKVLEFQQPYLPLPIPPTLAKSAISQGLRLV